MSTRYRSRLYNSERGSVLIAAMAVMGIALALGMVIIGVAITSGNTTGHDRQRLVAVDAAEAGVDSAYAKIQTSALTLPCNWPATGSTDVQSYPDSASYKVSISYYDSTSATPAAALPCPTGGTLPATSSSPRPTSASIISVGSTTALAGGQTGQRKMEALINLSTIGSGVLDKPIVGESGITFQQAVTVNGNVGSDADVYTNGDFYCGSSPVIRGSIYAPLGKIGMDQTCQTTADVWARDDVTINGNKTIGGRVLSQSGNVIVDKNTGIAGSVTANKLIKWETTAMASCRPGQCLANQSSVGAPPSQPFPILRGDDATMEQWRQRGYSVITPPAGYCGTTAGNWIATTLAPTLTVKTLVRTACDVTFSSTNTFQFARDFALVAYGGITASQQVTFASSTATAAAPRSVNMIVPYDAVTTRPCTTPTINVGGNFSSGPEISLLWYSPCDIAYSNGGGSYGAVYSGGKLTSGNAFTLTYRPIPLYGLDPTSQNPASWKVSIVYKREDRVG